ncbi:hypothetical protein TNCV_802831 [Trichonephila clavipes]|nr:hypothetical protein TNCV_802831 [Trichonephila clavipes]
MAETSRNITTRVIERDASGSLHKFLEECRGFLLLMLHTDVVEEAVFGSKNSGLLYILTQKGNGRHNKEQRQKTLMLDEDKETKKSG